MRNTNVRRSAVLNLSAMLPGKTRRQRLLEMFQERPDKSLPVNNKWQMKTTDPDLAYLLKKGVLVRSREGGSRRSLHPMNKSSSKRQTYLKLSEACGGGVRSLESGDGVRLMMFPDERRPGWTKALSDADIKVSYRPGRFGRTHWLLKSGNTALEVLQSPTQSMANPLDGLAPEQLELAEWLVDIGIASLATTK